MKRMIVMGILTALLVSLLGGCGNANPPEEKEERKTVEPGAEEGRAGNPFPQELKEIPSSYYSAAKEQGTLVELSYETYESMSYEQKSQKIMKRAIVYLPYNYDEEERYPTFYLMHGGWSNETTWLGTPDQPERFKNVIDHVIANQEMEPMIIVCPTYNNLSGSDSGDYGLAIKLTENYHNELVNDLMPVVEGTYSTYAEGTTAEDFRNSRDYRGFGGFSMGSVATWRTFEYCLDYFRYFMPSSGSLTTNGGYMDEIVKNFGRTWDEFFILAMTGTDDFAASAFERQIESMREYTESFRYSDSESEGNLTYRIKEGYSHDGKASTEYAYNGLRWLWHGGADAVSTEADGGGAAMAENRIIKLGKQTDFECHQMEHQLGAYTDCNHGEELAYARVEALADFIWEIGLPITLRELGVDGSVDLKEIADSCAIAPGSYKKMTHEEILEIFKECY